MLPLSSIVFLLNLPPWAQSAALVLLKHSFYISTNFDQKAPTASIMGGLCYYLRVGIVPPTDFGQIQKCNLKPPLNKPLPLGFAI